MRGGAVRRIKVSVVLVARDLVRDRVAAVLLLAIPTLLFVLIEAVMGNVMLPFQLGALGDRVVTAGERDLSHLFMGMAAISGLSAFLAFTLVIRPIRADQRLAFEGYRPAELLAAKVIVMLTAAVIVGVYVSALLPVFFRPARISGVLAAFVLTALVYGGLGMAIGAVVRDQFAGILMILLLVNIDAGWLQNPVFYGHARAPGFIELLPGHHPGQAAMISGFVGADPGSEIAAALVYAAGTLVLATALYGARVRVYR